jgi:VWFA-related protein
MLRLPSCLLGLFLAANALDAQAPVAASPDAVFRTTTRLVQVSVIAQDKDGKPVTELRREEFQIFDNGAPQDIQLFAAEKPALSTPELRAPNAFTNRIDAGTNRMDAGQGSAASGLHGGYSVILFDNLITEFAYNFGKGTGMARRKALETLHRMPAGEKIAIYALWRKLQIIREFTTDRDSLIRELTAMGGSVDTPSKNQCMPDPELKSEAQSGMLTDPRSPQAQQQAAQLQAMRSRQVLECLRLDALARASALDQELREIADHLAGVPGRKNLIWLATQFQISPGALRKLTDAGVAIYPVDLWGSRIMTAADKAAASAPLRALAAMTGGAFYFDRDDLDVAIGEAIEDGRISYTLGFYQPGEDKAAIVHQLGVRVSRPGVTLRYRGSYQTEPARLVSTTPVSDLVEALDRPADATAIPVTSLATRMQNRLKLSVSLDIPSLDLELSEGVWKGKVELVARFTTAEGTLAGDVLSETLNLTLRPATYTAALETGLPFRKELTIPAKAVELKLLIGNLVSGKIGTLTIPLSEVKEGEAKEK